MDENSQKNNWAALYPRNDIKKEKLEPYYDEIDRALSDDEVTNLALMAPYDSGKSSILLSYFKSKEREYPWWIKKINDFRKKKTEIKNNYCMNNTKVNSIKDYEFVNLPNFFNSIDSIKNKSSNKDENVDDATEIKNVDINSKLEQEIVKQLLFNQNPKRFPYSRIIRIKEYSNLTIFIWWIVVCFLIRNIPNIWNQVDKFTDGKWTIQLLLSLILLITLGILFHSLSKISVSINTTVGENKLSLSMDNTENRDYFNLFSDELLYYFKHAKINYVIFEDLDRFNSPIIFQKLHELNQNLNKQGNHIVFIYTLKDSIFDNGKEEAGRLKSKFFDYIIPILPLHSYQNSKQVLLEMNKIVNDELISIHSSSHRIYKASDFSISNSLLAAVGHFISDRREIIEVMHEYKIYHQKFQFEVIDKTFNDRLFAVMLYKDLCPEDYNEISSNKSKLSYLVNNISELRKNIINKEGKELREKIDNLGEEITHLTMLITQDIKTLLKVKFLNALENRSYFYVNGRGYSNYASSQEEFWKNENWRNDREIQKELNLTKYEVDLISKYFENDEEFGTNANKYINNKILERKKCLKKLDEVLTNIQDMSLGKIIDTFFVKKDNKKIISLDSKDLNESIEFIIDNPVLKYLVVENYLGEDFYLYLSPSAYTGVTIRDEKLIKNALWHQIHHGPDYHVDNPEKIIQELIEENIDFKYAYSPEIAGFFIIKGDMGNNKLKVLLENVRRNNDLRFIYDIFAYFESPKNRKIEYKVNLFKYLLENWSDFFIKVKKDDIALYQYVKWQYEVLFNKNLDSSTRVQLYNLLKENKMFDTETYQTLLIDHPNIQKVFLEYEPYKFANLQFAENDNEFLEELIKKDWYERNYDNFEIIVSYYRKNHNTLINNLGKISTSFANQFFVRYYDKIIRQRKTITPEELGIMLKWSNKSDSDNRLSILNLYCDAKFETNFTNDQKKKFLINGLQIQSIIANIPDDKLNKMIEQNKLIYNANLLSSLANEPNLKRSWSKYLSKYESKENINDIYVNKSLDFIITGIGTSKFPNKIIPIFNEKVKEEQNVPSDISERILKIIFNNITDIEVIRIILKTKFDNISINLQQILINKIFKEFPGDFTKKEISEFIFNNKDFISRWIINGNQQIVDTELLNDNIDGINLIINVIENITNDPNEYIKKGTNKYILKKNFNLLFKENI